VSAIDLAGTIRDLARRARWSDEQDAPPSLSIAIRLPGNSEAALDRHTIQAAQAAAASIPGLTSVAFVVPAAAPEGGRAHITRLRALRRLVEEWDASLGFDLTEATDARWEAEVAVQIAGPRLDLIRLGTRLPDALGQATDVRVRALAACGDLGFTGSIALVPPTPYWLSWHRPSVRRDLEHNRDSITRIFAERRILQRSFQAPMR
jgi:hypothetical protein